MQPTDDAKRREILYEYLHGLQWVLNYYNKGCCSWSWVYPYHYAPFLSDFEIMNTSIDFTTFTLDAPLTPLLQLL